MVSNNSNGPLNHADHGGKMPSLREDYSITPPELKDLLGVSVQAIHKIIKSQHIATKFSSRKHHILSASTRQILTARGFTYPNQVVSFQIVKGGTGKSTLSHSLAVRANQYGAKVLCIDLDQQGNLTQALGVRNSESLNCMVNILASECTFEDAIVEVTPTLHVIPSNMENSTLDSYLLIHRLPLEKAYSKPIQSIRKKYDLIIIDCPPAINTSNTAATLASDRIIIPVTPDKFSMEGLNITIKELNEIRKQYDKKIDLKIIYNRYDGRKALSSEYLGALHADHLLKPLLYRNFIRDNQELSNAIARKSSVFDQTKKSHAREDLDLFCLEVLGLDTFFEKRKNGELADANI